MSQVTEKDDKEAEAPDSTLLENIIGLTVLFGIISSCLLGITFVFQFFGGYSNYIEYNDRNRGIANRKDQCDPKTNFEWFFFSRGLGCRVARWVEKPINVPTLSPEDEAYIEDLKRMPSGPVLEGNPYYERMRRQAPAMKTNGASCQKCHGRST